MKLRATVSSEGQINIPASVLQQLGVGDGDEVEIVIDSDRALVLSGHSPRKSFRDYIGSLPSAKPGEANAVDWVKSLRNPG